MIVVRDPKTFCFDLYWPKYSDENMKREIEFIIKINEFLVKWIIETEQLLLKYKHGSSIHEYGKQQNKWTT